MTLLFAGCVTVKDMEVPGDRVHNMVQYVRSRVTRDVAYPLNNLTLAFKVSTYISLSDVEKNNPEWSDLRGKVFVSASGHIRVTDSKDFESGGRSLSETGAVWTTDDGKLSFECIDSGKWRCSYDQGDDRYISFTAESDDSAGEKWAVVYSTFEEGDTHTCTLQSRNLRVTCFGIPQNYYQYYNYIYGSYDSNLYGLFYGVVEAKFFKGTEQVDFVTIDYDGYNSTVTTSRD